MADPPSYEESATEYSTFAEDAKADAKTPQRLSIREEVGASRSQHVAALVSKMLPQIRDRARNGLSKSTLVLLPSNQDCSRKGQLVGVSEDENPILIQLEGRHDTLEFWTQQEAIDQLQSQMLAALYGGVPPENLPERTAPPPAQQKSTFFRRKQSKVPETMPDRNPAHAPVTVDVRFDEAHFRSETEYGLFETLRGRCVVVEVHVR